MSLMCGSAQWWRSQSHAAHLYLRGHVLGSPPCGGIKICGPQPLIPSGLGREAG